MNEEEWRQLAESFPLSALKTELYDELYSILALREAGHLDEVEAWLDEVEEFFELEYQASAETEDSDVEQLVRLAEMFSSEGVESWLEAFEQVRDGIPDEDVLASAQRGQRYLLLVREMARTP